MLVTTFDQPTPSARGRAHGEQQREAIAALAQRRIEALATATGHADRSRLASIGSAYVGALRDAAPELAQEVAGIAAGCGLPVAELMLIQAFDEIADRFTPADNPSAGDEGGVTLYAWHRDRAYLGLALIVPTPLTPMVQLHHIRPRPGNDELVLLSRVGSLGVVGINRYGVAAATTRLSTRRAGLGLAGPALVRQVLSAADTAAGRQRLWGHRLAGGGHFLIADGTELCGLEADSHEKVITRTSPRALHLHTNHYFDPKLRAQERPHRSHASFRRMEIASTALVQNPPRGATDVAEFLGSLGATTFDRAAGSGPHPPEPTTCIAVAMDLTEGRVFATQRAPGYHDSIEIPLSRWR
ncbi:MAG: hypothetical protein B7733_14215 [Myxococcales bacterium FL481]|nr:MAG: hypothetical protein B7733_14215 [Myxococcales bacterium FL481]